MASARVSSAGVPRSGGAATAEAGLDLYIATLAGFGLLVLLAAWLPMVLKELPLSLPILCIFLGIGVFASGVVGWVPDPRGEGKATERLTEFVVIVALMGAGLKLDRRIGWRTWRSTWRLLGIVMPLSILALAALGWGLLGLPLASALLLAAVLAPTDPVLAADVQVGPPGGRYEDEIRFALTSEAGLNDGLAFPFVNLALALALAGPGGEGWLRDWLLVDVVWKLGVGVAAGWAIGWGLGYLAFRLPNRAKLARTGDGFVALGITCLAYGLTELAHGYGFLAVFVAALALRDVERSHAYHERLHDFSDQIERLMILAVLLLFGGAIAGGLLRPLDWQGFAFGVVALLVVRPLAGIVGLAGLPQPAIDRAVTGFFGIRGVGSLYYLAYALERGAFAGADTLWAVTGFVVLASVILHGTTATPVMRRLDARRMIRGERRRPLG